MSQVAITFTDDEDEVGIVTMTVDFDPVLSRGEELTPAQFEGVRLSYIAKGLAEGRTLEDIAEALANQEED